jgi:hypothetical protein
MSGELAYYASAAEPERTDSSGVMTAYPIRPMLAVTTRLVIGAIRQEKEPTIRQPIVQKEVHTRKDLLLGDKDLFSEQFRDIITRLNDWAAQPSQGIPSRKLKG